MVSKRLRNAVKLSDLKAYEIARKADIPNSTLCSLLNNIVRVKEGDPRVIRIGAVMGLKPDDCFARRGRR